MLTGIKVATIFTAIAAATVTAFASVHAAPLRGLSSNRAESYAKAEKLY
jgi:hypothetical protein